MRPVLDQICGSQLALMQYNRRSFEAWIETLDFKSQDFSLTAFAAVDLLLKELVFVYRHESWIEQSFINFLKGRKEQLRCRSMNLFHAMNTPAVFLVSSVQCVQHNKSNSPWPHWNKTHCQDPGECKQPIKVMHTNTEPGSPTVWNVEQCIYEGPKLCPNFLLSLFGLNYCQEILVFLLLFPLIVWKVPIRARSIVHHDRKRASEHQGKQALGEARGICEGK